MEQEYIKGDIVMYDNKIHTIMDTLGVNNYELSYIEHPVNQLELSGVPITPEILEKNGWDKEPSENVTWYKYSTDKSNLYICKDSFNNKDWLVCVALDKHYVANIININYVHQLQHLLFCLGLPMGLKV